MSFREFFIKKIMPAFFISVTFISIAIGTLGIIYEPEQKFGYEAMFFPIMFGLAASLPAAVNYSKRELSVKESIVRKLIQLALIELIIISVMRFMGDVRDISILLSLAASVFIIYMAVNLVMYISDLRSAEEINRAVRKMQEKNK